MARPPLYKDMSLNRGSVHKAGAAHGQPPPLYKDMSLNRASVHKAGAAHGQAPCSRPALLVQPVLSEAVDGLGVDLARQAVCQSIEFPINVFDFDVHALMLKLPQ